MIDIRYQPDDIVVTIPKGLAASEYVQRFLEQLRVDAILSHGAASDEQIRALAEAVDADWWAGNRNRFICSPTLKR